MLGEVELARLKTMKDALLRFNESNEVPTEHLVNSELTLSEQFERAQQ